MITPSHRITDNGDKIVIHDLEVFCAFDPAIDDGDQDEELVKYDNRRVQAIVSSTNQYMAKGSHTRLVVMHERDGSEPKSSVGRFTKISYEDRNGVGYIIGDCEIERGVFDKLLATNAFPRRSAEIWGEQNHLSEVALLGRETPRRPLPDTNFVRTGERISFARPLRFDMGAVGGGLSSFVPNESNTMADNDDLKKQFEALSAKCDQIFAKFNKDEEETKKDEMSADDMITNQFANEEGEGDGIHIDIDSPDADEDGEGLVMNRMKSSRLGQREIFAIKRENARMGRELAQMKGELAAEKFSRELDAMESDGYRIPTTRRPRLIAELASATNPDDLIETWRDLFARDPMGIRIDMSRASLPQGDIDPSQISALVKEFAGKPEEFKKAINNRIKR